MAVTEWYEDHENLAELWRWMVERCEQPTGDDVALFLEKPWKWTPEWNQLQSELAAAA